MRLARAFGMKPTVPVLLLLALLGGCRRNPEDAAVSEPAPPAAALLAGQDRSLDQSLRDLDKELAAALSSGIDKGGQEHMFRAEAVTDRLLETKLPFTWLTTTS